MFTLFTYTMEGVPDDECPPQLFAGKLTLEQVTALTREECYPRQAVADYRHEHEPDELDSICRQQGVQLAPLEPVFIVSYSNSTEDADPDPDHGPDSVQPEGVGMEFTPEHEGVGALQVQVWYIDAIQIKGVG